MCKFNVVFHSSLSMLPALKTEVKLLQKILLGRFIKPEAIQEAGADLTQLNISEPALHLPDQQLGIGHTTWAYITDEEDFLDPSMKKIFFNGVKDFYKAVASTVMKKFTFNDSMMDGVWF